MSMPSILNYDTDLSAINQVLAAIGQSPITTINYDNPEHSLIANLVNECAIDVQNEGWTYNQESAVQLIPDADGFIFMNDRYLALDLYQPYPDGQLGVQRPTGSIDNAFNRYDVVVRQNKLYDKVHHTDVWPQGTYLCNVVYLFDYSDLPYALQRYTVAKASVRAAAQLIDNKELFSLLQQQEVNTRAQCVEYECSQGDYSFFGQPIGTTYRPFQPFHALRR